MSGPPRTPRGVGRELLANLRLAGPIAAGQLATMAINLVDVAALGHGPVDEFAGAALGRSIGFAFVALPLGIAQSLEASASQALGADEPTKAARAYRGVLAMSLLVFVPCFLLSLGAIRILPFLGTEPAVAAAGTRFLLAQGPGLALFLVSYTQRAFLQTHKQTSTFVAAAITANVVNLVACQLLINGDVALTRIGLPPIGMPPLGATGSGLANGIAMFVLVAFMHPATRKRLQHGEGARTTREECRRAIRLGIPIGLHFVIEIGAFTVAALSAGSLGAHVVAAHQTALSLASTTFMGVTGISGATAVRVGYAVGRGEVPLQRGLVGIGVGVGYMALCAVVFISFPESLVRLFTSDPAVIALGAKLVRIAAAFQIFDGIQAVGAGALRGAGDVRAPFVANLIGHWGFGLPLALGLAFGLHWGAPGLWWGLTFGLFLVGVALLWRFAVVGKVRVARV